MKTSEKNKEKVRLMREATFMNEYVTRTFQINHVHEWSDKDASLFMRCIYESYGYNHARLRWLISRTFKLIIIHFFGKSFFLKYYGNNM